MAAPDDDGAGAVNLRTGDGQIERTHDEPRAGQTLTVPRHGSGPIGDDAWLAGFRHPAVFECGKVGREQGEAVCGVAEEIALHENFGDDGGFVGVEASAGEERGGVGDEGGGRVARGHGANVGGKEKTLQPFGGRVWGGIDSWIAASPAARAPRHDRIAQRSKRVVKTNWRGSMMR